MAHAAPEERAEILADLTDVFREHLALAEWGRLLVEIRPDPEGRPRVADVSVEDIWGDEALVDQAFGGDVGASLMPQMATVVATLSALDGVDVRDTEGGTFVHWVAERRLEFLPGLVRAPSAEFEQARDDVREWHRQAEADIITREALAQPLVLETDMEQGTFSLGRRDGTRLVGKQVVLGSFAHKPRTWVWGGDNPSLTSAARARSKALVDGLPERAAWEVSTPVFATDAPTALDLAMWAAKGGGADWVHTVRTPDGLVVLALFLGR